LATSADWVLDKEELEGMFTSKTKIIVLNTPHNPLGKVFKREELESIADLCKKWNVLCISDEVFEWVVYKPNRHIRIGKLMFYSIYYTHLVILLMDNKMIEATFPGMWERTITIGSAGKTFGVTGWKVGWAYGPANLMVNLQIVHQSCVYMMNTPIQVRRIFSC
jgi:kynurenine--oxoglutarate transaminase/cysteine-S-conjugate beta-lyase/glutamine--phenylpyruvate transaminase